MRSVLFLLVIFCIISTSVSKKKSFTGRLLNLRYKPITRNVDTKNTEACPTSDPLQLTVLRNAVTTLINTGQSVQTNDQRHATATVYSGPLANDYIYLSFTYYWASNATTGVTGTTIDNNGFPYGVRVFYINQKYTTFEEALNKEDGFVDQVFLFSICSNTNLPFDKISRKIQKIPKAGSFTPVPLITQIVALNIPLYSQYYTYKGEFLDTYTNKKYQSSTVFIFKPNKKTCITQHQFNQTFSQLTNFQGKPLSNVLPHDSSELRSSLCNNGLLVKYP